MQNLKERGTEFRKPKAFNMFIESPKRRFFLQRKFIARASKY
jgi:hypothetical protein